MTQITLTKHQFDWISTFPRGCVIEDFDNKVVIDIAPWNFTFQKQNDKFIFECEEKEYKMWQTIFENDLLVACE